MRGPRSSSDDVLMPARLPPVRRSLQTKAIIAVAALVGLSTTLTGVLAQRQTTAAMEEALLRDSAFVADTASHLIERSLERGEGSREVMEQLLARLLRNGRISFMVVRNASGVLLADRHNDVTGWHEYQMQLAPEERQSALALNRSIPLRGPDGSLLVVRRQVITRTTKALAPDAPGPLLGHLEMGMYDPQLALLSKSLNQTTFWVVTASCLLFLPLVIWWVRGWTAPLREMVGAALRLGMGGPPEHVIGDRQDEIGLLGRAFNAMAVNLMAIQHALVEANAQLEQKVAERTTQLEDANARLAHEIGEKDQLNQQLESAVKLLQEHAATDPLTGLANRRHIQTMLDRTFSEAHRYGTDLACLMMDLDGFKPFNDTLGHLEGDRMLQTMARVLIANCRQCDVAGRYGGDEFVLLLPRTDPELARQVATRVMQEFAAAAQNMAPPDLTCNVSVGIACVSMTRPASADQLVAMADSALYRAKQQGKARIHLYDAVHQRVSSR